jgi:hypothetical protein
MGVIDINFLDKTKQGNSSFEAAVNARLYGNFEI